MSTTQFYNPSESVHTIDSRSFDPVALENGDVSQLSLFKNSSNASIYVEWVPDELTKEMAEDRFFEIGVVSGIDFVNKRTGKARMMFVHFSSIHQNSYKVGDSGVDKIVSAYPNACPIPIIIHDHLNIGKFYQLRCRINTKPIKRVEYNNAQLTDMVDRLRKELDELKEQLANK